MIEQILFVPVLIFSVIVHECAHGIAANRAGDPTAKLLGRITLNPIPHIDLFGSIIIPVILMVTHSPFLFGWAKPVPVNPSYFKNYRKDEIRVSLAGPASNILLSIIFLALAILVIILFNIFNFSAELFPLYFSVLRSGMLINLVLAFFNLIPIPPLDGSHIVENLLPYRYSQLIAVIRPYSFIILLIVIVTPVVNIAYLPVKIIFNLYLSILQWFFL